MDLLFSSLSLKRLLYLILVAGITFWASTFFHGYREVYWLIWSAFILSLITTGDSFKRRINVIVITGLCAAFVAYFAAALASPLLMAIYLLFVTATCVSIGQRFPLTSFQIYIIGIFAILSACLDTSIIGDLQRFEFICLGTAIAGLLQIVFYPYFVRNELKPYLIISLKDLKKLNTEIFACLLEPAYPENIYLFERRLHLRKNDYLSAMTRLREIARVLSIKMTNEEKASHDKWISSLDFLFENMMDYSQLRQRVSDFSTYSVCAEELKNICAAINDCLDSMMAHVKNKKLFINTTHLNEMIGQLENNYHHVLQVAAREPYVFLLFIDSLNSFSHKMEELYSHDIPITDNLS